MATSKKTYLITGGTKGLGLATAKTFASPHSRLILTYRSDEANARSVAEELQRESVECHCIQVDLTEETASDTLFDQVSRLTDEIAVYVHNAAATAFKGLLEIKPHQIQKTFNISVLSLISNVQRLVPLMKNGGCILTVSGMDTLEMVPMHGLLAAAKASVEMLTRYLAHELADKNIRVNGVVPGYIPTDSTRKYLGPRFDMANKMAAHLTPGHRVADPEEVASVIAFLASEGARWIVGQNLVVDGGWNFGSRFSNILKER